MLILLDLLQPRWPRLAYQGTRKWALLSLVVLSLAANATPVHAEECPKELPPDVKCKSVQCDKRLPEIDGGPFICFEATYLKPPPPKKLLIRYNYQDESSFLIEFSRLVGGDISPGLRLHLEDRVFCVTYEDRAPICIDYPPKQALRSDQEDNSQELDWNQAATD
jgi:hypothetical protein